MQLDDSNLGGFLVRDLSVKLESLQFGASGPTTSAPRQKAQNEHGKNKEESGVGQRRGRVGPETGARHRAGGGLSPCAETAQYKWSGGAMSCSRLALKTPYTPVGQWPQHLVLLASGRSSSSSCYADGRLV